MRSQLYRLSAIVMLSASVAGCSPFEDEQIPQPTANSSTSDAYISSWAIYGSNASVPEPMSDVTAVYTGESGDGGTANHLLTLAQSQASSGGNKIYHFRQNVVLAGTPRPWAPYDNGTWSQVTGPNGGGATKIVISGSSAYAVTSQNQLWITNSGFVGGFSTTPTWTQVALPTGVVDIATYGSYIYFLGTDVVNGGHPIYRLSNGIATLVTPDGAAIELAVDGFGRPWVVNSLNEIQVGPIPGSGGGFQLLPGAARDIACSGENIGIIGTTAIPYGYEIYTRSAGYLLNTTAAWTREAGAATRIGASQGRPYPNYIEGSFFIVNTIGEVFKGK